jgi:macrolide-specific efflux system membrane fusion protein
METKIVNSEDKSATTVKKEASEPLLDQPMKFGAIWKRRGLWLIVALLIIGAGVFGYYRLFSKAKVTYTTAAVERGNIENTVVAAGIVQPIKYVDVGAQTSGKLKLLKVKRGDQVEEGTLLAEIDPVLAQTSLTSAKATLENVTSQRSIKEAQFMLAKTQWNRDEVLFSQLVISASDYDISHANFDVAFAETASLSAQMKQAKASVNTAEANLGYTKILAPMAGEVVSINILEGQTLNANQQAPNILRIADMSIMTVWAQVSEADIARVKPDQDVYFTVLGQNKRWNGKIRQILPTPELISNVVFYNVLFDIPNPQRELHIQMTAQVFIVLSQAKGVLLIPTVVIRNAEEGAETEVQVLKPDGLVEKRRIKIGIRSEISTEVLEGLTEKELIVIGEITAKANTKNVLNVRKGL